MALKYLLSSLLLLIGIRTVNSQSQSQKWISTSQDEYVVNMKYLYSDILFLVTYRGEQAQTYQEQFTNYSNVLYKSDFNLDFSDSLTIDEIGNYDILVKNFLRVDNTGILYWAKALEKNTQDEQLCLLWFDENLNLVNSQMLGSPDLNETVSDAIQCANGNLLFVGTTGNDLLSSSYIIWLFDEQLQEINKDILSIQVQDYPKIIEIPSMNKYHVIAGFMTYQFDENLEYDTTYEFPSDINIHPQPQNKLYDDSHYVKTGLYLSAPIPGSPWEMDMALCLMDQDANLIQTYTYGITDSTDVPAGMDFITSDTIYLAGTRNLSFNPPKNSFVALYITDTDGNTNGYKLWGGEGQYVCSGVTALPQGGYVLSMTKWDYQANPDTVTRDIFLVTENYGNPVTNEQEYYPSAAFLIYPNPGTEQLNISTDKINCRLRLFNTSSMLVLDKRFDRSAFFVTSHLPKGIYIYEVSQNDKVMGHGKWLKR